MTSLPRRPVLRVLLRRHVILWLGAAFVGGGLTTVANGARLGLQERTYRVRGDIVQATVIAKELHPATRERSTSYAVVVRFIDTDGRPLEDRQAVDAATWERLGVGSLIAIEYLPGDPRSIRLAGRTRVEDVALLFVFGLVFSAGGAVIVVVQGPRFLRDWHVVRAGVPVAATVTGTSPTNIRLNGRTQWAVSYRYADATGRQHEGRSPSMSPETAQAWRSGDRVAVRFDQERPEASLWMGDEPPRERTPGPAVGAEPKGRWRRMAARYGFVASLILGGLALAIAAEIVPLLRDVVAFVDRHWRPLVTITAGAAAAGFVLFIGGILHMLLSEGGGGQGSVVASAGEIKAAWRRRAWRHDVHWRYTFLVVIGTFMMLFGGFSTVVVLTESFLRFMMLLALAYAALRTAWAFYRA